MSFVPARFPNAAPTTAYRSPIALYFPNEAPTKAYGPVLNQRRGPGGWPRRGPGEGSGGWPRRFVPARFIIRSPMALYFPNAAPTMAEGPVLNQRRGPGGWPRRGLRRFVPALFIIRSPMALYFPNAAPTMAEGPVDNQQPPTVWRPSGCRQPATSSNGPASTPGIPLKVDLRKRRSDGRLPSTFARLG